MSFGPVNPAVANAIQQNYLRKEFEAPLLSTLKYRLVAERKKFLGRIGTTITDTRVGLMIPNITPLNPSTNTNLDNGLSPQSYTSEQYTLAINQYPQLAPDINLIDDETTIAAFLLKNSFNLGYASSQSTERLARNALFNAYLSGNTRVTTTLGSANVTITVDDTRGFQTVVVNGIVLPVSGTNTLPVYIGANATPYQISGFANDVTNISSAAITGGTSGTITATTTISTTDGTLNNPVIMQYAPLIVRPNGRKTTEALIVSDTLDMVSCFNAVSQLRSNGALPFPGGFYNFYVSPALMTQLFNDPSFQILNRGVGTEDPAYKHLGVTEFLGMRFITTTEAFVQLPNNGVAQVVQRAIACGQDVLIEGQFDDGRDAIEEMLKREGVGNLITSRAAFPVSGYNGFIQYLRGPLDRLGQIVSQTSNWIGGYTVPTDVGTTSAIIPTSNQAYYKRAVVIETA